MTEDAFYAHLDHCVAQLQAKQAFLQSQYGLGQQARWWFDQSRGELLFYNDPQTAIDWVAQVVVIGSFAPGESTWKWGYANASLTAEQRDACSGVRLLSTLTGVLDFDQEEPFEVSPEMAWELAAVAVEHLGLLGVYRAPSNLGQHQWFLGICALGNSRNAP
jgi:hypothetical protein